MHQKKHYQKNKNHHDNRRHGGGNLQHSHHQHSHGNLESVADQKNDLTFGADDATWEFPMGEDPMESFRNQMKMKEGGGGGSSAASSSSTGKKKKGKSALPPGFDAGRPASGGAGPGSSKSDGQDINLLLGEILNSSDSGAAADKDTFDFKSILNAQADISSSSIPLASEITSFNFEFLAEGDDNDPDPDALTFSSSSLSSIPLPSQPSPPLSPPAAAGEPAGASDVDALNSLLGSISIPSSDRPASPPPPPPQAVPEGAAAAAAQPAENAVNVDPSLAEIFGSKPRRRYYRRDHQQMSAEDVNQVLRSHYHQMQTPTPYRDDFYYQVYLDQTRGTPQTHVPVFLHPRGPSSASTSTLTSSSAASTTTSTTTTSSTEDAEPVLGRVAPASVRRPRPALDLAAPLAPLPSAAAKASSSSFALLLSIERAFAPLLDAEDCLKLLRCDARPEVQRALLAKREPLCMQLFKALPVLVLPRAAANALMARAASARDAHAHVYQHQHQHQQEEGDVREMAEMLRPFGVAARAAGDRVALDGDAELARWLGVPKGCRVLARTARVLPPPLYLFVAAAVLRAMASSVSPLPVVEEGSSAGRPAVSQQPVQGQGQGQGQGPVQGQGGDHAGAHAAELRAAREQLFHALAEAVEPLGLPQCLFALVTARVFAGARFLGSELFTALPGSLRLVGSLLRRGERALQELGFRLHEQRAHLARGEAALREWGAERERLRSFAASSSPSSSISSSSSLSSSSSSSQATSSAAALLDVHEARGAALRAQLERLRAALNAGEGGLGAWVRAVRALALSLTPWTRGFFRAQHLDTDMYDMLALLVLHVGEDGRRALWTAIEQELKAIADAAPDPVIRAAGGNLMRVLLQQHPTHPPTREGMPTQMPSQMHGQMHPRMRPQQHAGQQ